MTRTTKLFTMFATLAGLTLATAAPTARADRYEYESREGRASWRGDYDRNHRDHGRDHDRGHDRDDDHGDYDRGRGRRRDRDDDYGHRRRVVTYTVRYTLDCEKVVRVDGRQEAIDLTHNLRSYGVEARRRKNAVYYSSDCTNSRTFASYDSAKRVSRWLKGLGFDVEVVS